MACIHRLVLAAAAIFCVSHATGQERKILKLEIKNLGMSLNEGDETSVATCRDFRPTARQVRNFFLRSYPVPGAYMAHDLYSDCYAIGEITFNDNKSFGKWILYSTGVARIDWDFGGEVYLLYRKNKWYNPMGE
ncbi:hypothetical protein QTH90_26765 [Variovorax sp. J2P1-59]|uniref:hypothetical protein n=1 Tax=Variovorax flavidus TaxID=3053501 RepID=UPI002574E81B|nr:hypothetical protein [Variovorax sp. J2P1-59]MDM0078041.1 hypothetical protein [Variovorax sp. J2P1-59]